MPAEQTGELTSGVAEPQAQRSLPTPFLTKTYQLVDDTSVDDLVSWNEDGTTFIVWRPAEFARDLLPKYFKHNNFSSFVRQLNTYGFRKVVPDRWEFTNDCFRKGEKQLLRDIQRRKIIPSPAAAPSPFTAIPTIASSGQEITVAVPSIKAVSTTNSSDEQVLSSNSSPTAINFPTFVSATSCTTTADLIEENDRLRKENARMSEELKKLKSLCGSVYHMMSNFAVNQPESSGGGGGGLAEGKSMGLMVEGTLRAEVNSCGVVNGDKRNFEDESEMDISHSDLDPSPSPNGSPRLFGVCLKRRRVNQMQQVHESGDINAESLHGGTGAPDDSTWLGLDINRSTRNIIQR